MKDKALKISQQHLKYEDMVNQGGYYTPPDCVKIVWEMINPYINSNTIIMDSACGYGNFLQNPCQSKMIGSDLDETAIALARKNNKKVQFFQTNSLQDLHRSKFGISSKSHLIVIGNPPYNDRTSIIRHKIKDVSFPIDPDLARRDLGVSFLLSYDKLQADWICVLHPLSYLIKSTNFKLLKNFTLNYRLIDGLLISSHEFPESSKFTSFPIVIALYRRDPIGMEYEFIRSFRFRTRSEDSFCLSDFDYIPRYITKYPSKKKRALKDQDPLFFWTIRDINALKRNQTFVEKQSSNTILIDKKKLVYYVYVDVFKRNTHKLPFYFGNCDVMINDESFKHYQPYFIRDAINHHPFLEKHIQVNNVSEAETKDKIDRYFSSLFGGHLDPYGKNKNEKSATFS